MNRLVFCMFAEDVGLLPDAMFTRMLEQARRRPASFADMAGVLFGAMAERGGLVGFEPVAWFNGGLFDDDTALPLERDEIDTALRAAALDWSEIDPSILGTLFERGLDPDKRSQLGAHYTDRDKIMRIVEPAIVRPLLAAWAAEKEKIAAAVAKEDLARPARRLRRRGPVRIAASQKMLDAFLKRLQDFTVLDPACGSGNFLYPALHALKDIEHRVQLEAEALGFERRFPAVGPANVRGIEINAYAAELARVSVWIGEIQWMRRNGFNESRDPILKPLDNIECRDAILAPDGTEPAWPAADVVIGNPPFLGGKLLIGGLGEDYVARMFAAWRDRVPREADLVCYWFVKAGEQVAAGRATRVGLVATNSIRGGANRRALRAATQERPIFEAWSDEPWVIDGAAVRVSLVCFSGADDGHRPEMRLDGEPADEIHTDLTARRGGSGPI
ncbi:MAG: N-6 DNA methylase [Defluviicoccus sp.]|nr:N-6 DNA methylase [Defluviicoccus sp.]